MLVSDLGSSEAETELAVPVQEQLGVVEPKRKARGFSLPEGAKLKSRCEWYEALDQVVRSVEEAERVVRVQHEKSVKPCHRPGGALRASNSWLVQQIIEMVTIHGTIKRVDLTRALGYTASQLKVVIKELIDQKRLQYVNASKASRFIKLQLGPGQGAEYVSHDTLLDTVESDQ